MGIITFRANLSFPRGRFVPSGRQNYSSEIMANVDSILNAYRTADIDVSGQPLDLAAKAILTTCAVKKS